MGPAESFDQLLAEQPAWISDLIKFVTFAPDQHKYDKMASTMDDMLTTHDDDGYLIAGKLQIYVKMRVTVWEYSRAL